MIIMMAVCQSMPVRTVTDMSVMRIVAMVILVPLLLLLLMVVLLIYSASDLFRLRPEPLEARSLLRRFARLPCPPEASSLEVEAACVFQNSQLEWAWGSSGSGGLVCVPRAVSRSCLTGMQRGGSWV